MSHHISSSLVGCSLPPCLVSPFQPPDSSRGSPVPVFSTESKEYIRIRVSKNTTKLNPRLFTFEREKQGGRILRKRNGSKKWDMRPSLQILVIYFSKNIDSSSLNSLFITNTLGNYMILIFVLLSSSLISVGKTEGLPYYLSSFIKPLNRKISQRMSYLNFCIYIQKKIFKMYKN